LSPKEIHRQLIGIALIALLPILSTRYLPYLDYPNHVARFALLGKHQGSDIFQAFYRVNPIFVPNLGFDILAVNLSKFMHAADATRLVLAGAIFAGITGWGKLILKLGNGFQPFVVCIPLFFYSYAVFAGFLNFVLGMGLVPWIVYLYRLYLERRSPELLIAYLLLAITCFVSHALSSLIAVFFSVVVNLLWKPGTSANVGDGSVGKVSWQKVVLGALAPLPVMAILLKLSPSSGEFSRIVFGSLKHKMGLTILALRSPTFTLDMIILGAITLIAAFLLVTKRATLSKKAVIFAGICWLLAVLTPTALSIAANMDHRLGYFAPMVLLAFIEVRQMKFLAVVAVLLLTGLRSGLLMKHHLSFEKVSRQAEGALHGLREDAIVFNIPLGRDLIKDPRTYNPALLNLPHVALWERPMMISGLYSYPMQQPMVYSDLGGKLGYLGVSKGVSAAELANDIQECRKRMKETGITTPAFAFVSSPEGLPSLPKDLVQVAKGPKFWIFKIDPLTP